jgi:hypothetical protein
MKRIGSLLLVLVLALPALAGCTQPMQAAATPFDALARWVPADAEFVFFLDLRPGGEPGRHWERIRQRMEANPAGQEALNSLLNTFRVERYGLGELIVGPAVNWSGHGAEHLAIQVHDEGAAGDALRQHFQDVAWEQVEHEGRTLYHGRNLDSWRQREHIAWTIGDGLLFLSFSYDQVYDREPLTALQALLDLDQADSLASLPAWRALRDRLPATPMGLMFANTAAQARRSPPPPGDTSLEAAMNRQLVAIALAAVPEEEGMRVEIAGEVVLQPGTLPEFRAMFDLPAVDPAAWAGLPADTAFTLVGHDLSVLWPWLSDMFNMDALDQLRDVVGLDLEADLAGVDGPLTGDFALAATPPLPDHPIIQGVPAGQFLILARGASEAQAAGVRAAMEGRGAVFGRREVEGVTLQTQVGTELTGYAISYSFDGDTFLFGSSPGVVGQAVAASREHSGLVTTAAFRAARRVLPADPSLVVYFNCGAMTRLAQANMTDEQYQKNLEYRLLESFEAIVLGLRFPSNGQMDGVVYFFVEHDP